jgi:hypothetical protein
VVQCARFKEKMLHAHRGLAIPAPSLYISIEPGSLSIEEERGAVRALQGEDASRSQRPCKPSSLSSSPSERLSSHRYAHLSLTEALQVWLKNEAVTSTEGGRVLGSTGS